MLVVLRSAPWLAAVAEAWSSFQTSDPPAGSNPDVGAVKLRACEARGRCGIGGDSAVFLLLRFIRRVDSEMKLSPFESHNSKKKKKKKNKEKGRIFLSSAGEIPSMPYGEAPWIFTGRCVSSIPWSVGDECGLGERGRSSGSNSFRRSTLLAKRRRCFFSFLSSQPRPPPYPHHSTRALYQLQLVPLSEAKKHIPPDFHIVSLFG